MKFNEFWEWSNPLWSFIVAGAVFGLTSYLVYLIGAYTFPRRDYTSAVFGLVYCVALAWLSYMFVSRDLQLLRK